MRGDVREIPFDFAQGKLSLHLKNGFARDDADNLSHGYDSELRHYGQRRGPALSHVKIRLAFDLPITAFLREQCSSGWDCFRCASLKIE